MPGHNRFLYLACGAIGLLVMQRAAAQPTDLVALAAQFPPMPRDTAGLGPFVSGPPTFASGTPFNDIEYTLFNTDYIDGENSGFDTFLPVDPAQPFPGADTVKYIRCALNTDLDLAYQGAPGDRIILGTHEVPVPFFLAGNDGIDNDYAVIQHLDFENGHIQLRGEPSQYSLIYAAEEDGAATEGWYLFFMAGEQPDLIAFVYPCDDIEPAISGNPPNRPDPYCNTSGSLSLTDPEQFRFAAPLSNEPAMPLALAQAGHPGRDIVEGLAVDATGAVYLVGLTDGATDGPEGITNKVSVTKVLPTGQQAWTTEVATEEGTLLFDAEADGEYLYACGRTLGSLPEFTNAGRWDGILLKLRLTDGQVIATSQWGNPGIDGYGNIVLDGEGHLYVSGQGAPPGPATNDDSYLVAKYRTSDLGNVWRAIDPIETQGFAASAEAWGGLTFAPGETPQQDRLVAAGWYFTNNGADAFLAVYENLQSPSPRRAAFTVLSSAGPRAEWILDNAVDAQGNIYVAGFTTGVLGNRSFGEGDAYIARFDPTLSQPQFLQIGTEKSDLIRSLEIGPDGFLYATGYTYGNLAASNADASMQSGDLFALKLSQQLQVVNQVQFGTPHEDRASMKLRHGRLTLAGTTEGSLAGPSHGSFDGFALQLDRNDLQIIPPTEPFNGWLVH